MLTKRIIPCLDVKGGRVVKGTSFVQLRDAGDPVELASFYYTEGADELVFLDIAATPEERDTSSAGSSATGVVSGCSHATAITGRKNNPRETLLISVLLSLQV